MRLRNFKFFAATIFLLFSLNNIFAVVDWANGATITNANSVTDDDLRLANGAVADATIDVNGFVYINANTVDVNVYATSYNVSLRTLTGVANYGHIVFNAAANRTINVYCDYDLKFRSGTTSSDPAHRNDMMVTFKGAGKVIFHLKDYNSTTASSGQRGVQVAFEGTALGGYNYPKNGETFTQIGWYQPCRVYILMDQTEADAVTS